MSKRKKSSFNTNPASYLSAPVQLNKDEESAGSASGAGYGALLESDMEGMVSDQAADLEDEISDYRAIAAKGVW
jgi:hypothetical protein